VLLIVAGSVESGGAKKRVEKQNVTKINHNSFFFCSLSPPSDNSALCYRYPDYR